MRLPFLAVTTAQTHRQKFRTAIEATMFASFIMLFFALCGAWVQPIAPTDSAKRAFDVIVGGKRYGKGSSREHSPLAEKSAGIKLVIA